MQSCRHGRRRSRRIQRKRRAMEPPNPSHSAAAREHPASYCGPGGGAGGGFGGAPALGGPGAASGGGTRPAPAPGRGEDVPRMRRGPGERGGEGGTHRPAPHATVLVNRAEEEVHDRTHQEPGDGGDEGPRLDVQREGRRQGFRGPLRRNAGGPGGYAGPAGSQSAPVPRAHGCGRGAEPARSVFACSHQYQRRVHGCFRRGGVPLRFSLRPRSSGHVSRSAPP